MGTPNLSALPAPHRSSPAHSSGRAAGFAEGRAAGREHGFAIGAEVGAAAGAAAVWVALAGEDPPRLPARAGRAAQAVLDLAAAVPLSNPQDERLTDALSALRAKLKVAASMVGPELSGGVGGGSGGGGRLDF